MRRCKDCGHTHPRTRWEILRTDVFPDGTLAEHHANRLRRGVTRGSGIQVRVYERDVKAGGAVVSVYVVVKREGRPWHRPGMQPGIDAARARVAAALGVAP